MQRLLITVLAFFILGATASAHHIRDLRDGSFDNTFVVHTETCPDSGDGSNGSVTIDPNPPVSVIHLTNSDADGCDVTMAESNVSSGLVVLIVVVSNAGGTVNFANTSGVTELQGSVSLDLWEAITLEYAVDRYVAANPIGVDLDCAAGEVVLDPKWEDGVLVEGTCGAN